MIDLRLWAISVLLGWCLDLTPATKKYARILQIWAWAAEELGNL